MNHVPARFAPIDALSEEAASLLPSTLRNINPSANYQAILIRLLTGTLNFKCASIEKTIIQRHNYSVVFFQRNKRLSAKILKDAFSSFATLDDIDQHLTKGLTHNNKFYREILFEFGIGA